MRIVIIGCGSIGLRHFENVTALGQHEVVVCETSAERRQWVQNTYAIQVLACVDQALEQSADLAFICTPTHTHVPLARRGLEAGLHVFIEKPISHTLEGIAELLALAQQRHRLLFVGHCMRFDPSIMQLHALARQGCIGRILSAYVQGGHYLPQWRPHQDYRTVYSSHRDQGGGVILDYLHDFDYLRWILGEARAVFCAADKLSDLEIDTEDHAVALMRMETGAFATLQADYLRRRKWRSCELVGERGSIKWETEGKAPQHTRVTVAYNNQDVETVYAGEDGGNDIYEAEVAHVLACVEGREESKISGEEGLKSLTLALAAQQSCRTGQWVELVHGGERCER